MVNVLKTLGYIAWLLITIALLFCDISPWVSGVLLMLMLITYTIDKVYTDAYRRRQDLEREAERRETLLRLEALERAKNPDAARIADELLQSLRNS